MRTAFYVVLTLVILALALGWLVGGLYLGVWCCWVLSVVDIIKQCKAGEACNEMSVALDLLFFFIVAPITNAIAIWGATIIAGVGLTTIGTVFGSHSVRIKYR